MVAIPVCWLLIFAGKQPKPDELRRSRDHRGKPRSRTIDEQLLAGTMLLSQHQISFPVPALTVMAEMVVPARGITRTRTTRTPGGWQEHSAEAVLALLRLQAAQTGVAPLNAADTEEVLLEASRRGWTALAPWGDTNS